MKKFKEFKVNATENKIVQNEVISHLTKLGYDSSVLEGGLYLIHKSGNVTGDVLFNSLCREELTLDEFFKLTPDDVVIEPDKELWMFSQQEAEGVNWLSARITQDQIDRIKSIMDEES